MSEEAEESEERWLWLDDKHAGPFGIQKLYRMAKRGEIDQETLFWSERMQTWRKLPALMCDQYPDRLDEMKRVGIEFVECLTAQNGNDCPVCVALERKRFRIDEAPELPPVGCSCLPWCGALFIAVR